MRSYPPYQRCACRPTRNPASAHLAKGAAHELKVASVPSKLEILLILDESPHCVCDLTTHTKFPQTLVSHHLSSMAKAGLVRNAKTGAFVDYSLTEKGRKLVRTVKKLNP